MVALLGHGQPVVEVEVGGRDGLRAQRALETLDGQAGAPGLHEEPGQDLGGRAVVLVGRRHALQERDRAVAVARRRRRLTALEREPRALEQGDRARGLARLLVELGRRLQLARALVAVRGAVLHARADVDAARRRPALRRLVGAGGLGEHPDGLEQLRRALVELRRLGVLPLAQADVRRLLEVAAAAVDLQRARQGLRLLVQAAGLERALLVGGGAGGRVGRAEGDVLHEVLLVALRGLGPLLLLLVRLGRAQRIAALGVELRRLVPLPGLAEQARRLERVALLEEQRRRLGRLVGGDEDLGRLLVIAGLQIEVGRLLEPAHLLEVDGGGVVLLPLDVGLHRLREPSRVLEQLARGQVLALLLVGGDGAVELALGVARTEDLVEHAVHARPAGAAARDAHTHAGGEPLVDEEGGDDEQDVREIRNGEDVVHFWRGPSCRMSGGRL